MVHQQQLSLLALSAVALFGGWMPANASDDHELAKSLRQQGAILPLSELLAREELAGARVIEAELEFGEGTMTTVAATGTLAGEAGIIPQVVADAPMPNAEGVQLRASHFSFDAPAVDIAPVGGDPVLDLDYPEDSTAETDMNVVMNDGGAFIELQGTAEGHAFRHDELDAMLALADRSMVEMNERSELAVQDRKAFWKRGRGDAGYAPGEKITIKVNLVGCHYLPGWGGTVRLPRIIGVDEAAAADLRSIVEKGEAEKKAKAPDKGVA